MSKGKRTHVIREQEKPSWLSSLSPTMQDVLSIALLYVVTLILFRGIIFENAAFSTEGDTASWYSYAHAGAQLQETEKVDVLWMPFFFSGMPTFGNVAFVPHDVSYLQLVGVRVLNLLYLNGTWTWFVVYYFLSGVFMFFLMRVWKFSRVAALVAAITVMLSPYAVGLAADGHGSKLMALSYLPLVVLLTHMLFERKDILSLGLLGAAIGTLMLTNHMQIVYYEFIFLGLYWAYDVSRDIPRAYRSAIGKTFLFAAALAIGFCISSYIYLSVYEYAQYSMRGGGTTGATGGLAYDYATNWSWHPAELITLLIPGFFGMKAEYYWGPMIPWTNASVYVGILPILFGIIALTLRRTRLVVFFGLTTLLIFLMSLGRNFSLLYEPLFSILPFFNKFRAPEMILHLLPFTLGVLGAAGFTVLLEARERGSAIKPEAVAKALTIAGGIVAALFVLALLSKSGLSETLSGALFSKDGETDQLRQQYGAQAPRVLAQIKLLRFDIFWKDYVKFSLLAIAGCGLIVAWLKSRIQEWTFSAAVIVLLILDLSLVSSKYIEPKESANLEKSFRPDATITFLKGQGGLFRIFAGISPADPLYMDNSFAYHGLQSITGYSPAKLKIYQTLIDSCLYKGANPAFPLNMSIVNMLNVEYLVAHGRLPEPEFQLANFDQSRRTLTYRNPRALPRAFYVGATITASTDHEVFEALNAPEFDPSRTAVLYKPLPQPIGPVDSTLRPRITSYQSREIHITTDTPSPALLVLSEVYYPAGWKAFVDGNETEIYRTNFILRSVLLPAGSHEIVFRFDPLSYRTGWLLSNASWALACVCVLIGIWRTSLLRRRARTTSADGGQTRG